MCRQCIGNTSVMLLWTFCLKEDFVKGEAILIPIFFFAPPWIHPLKYLLETTTRMAAFQSKAFCLEALFDSFLPCLESTQGRICLSTCAGNKNNIPTKFHKHPSSGSVVKADYVCSHIYTCISASTNSFT